MTTSCTDGTKATAAQVAHHRVLTVTGPQGEQKSREKEENLCLQKSSTATHHRNQHGHTAAAAAAHPTAGTTKGLRWEGI